MESLVVNMISEYAPKLGCEESIKEKFWKVFNCVIMDEQDREEVYVGEDSNGHREKQKDGYYKFCDPNRYALWIAVGVT